MTTSTQSFRTIAPPVSQMTAFAIPPVRRRLLPSGIEMVIYDKCDAPVCYLTCCTPGGNLELPSQAYGALIGILRREGTASWSGEEINSILDFNGALVKSVTNDHSSCVSLRVLNSNLKATLPLIREMITSPSFNETPLTVRREALARNLEVSANDVDFLAGCASDKLIKGPFHPGAKVDTPDEVRAITSSDLLQTFHCINHPELSRLFIAGNITPQVEDLIAETFSTLPETNRPYTPRIIPYTPAPALSVEKIVKPDTLQSSVMITIPTGIQRSHPDYIGLHIAVSALGGYFGSRLMLNIRERLGLTYGISASLLGSPEGSFIEICADTDCDSVEQLRQEVNAELRRMATNPPEGEELNRLKQTLISGQAAVLDSPFSIIDQHVTSMVASIPEGYFENKLKAIATLTPDALAQTARKYMRPEEIRTAIAGR